MERGKPLIVLIVVLAAPFIAVILVLTGFSALSADPAEALSSESQVKAVAQTQADLGLAMALEDDEAVAGDLITYSLTVTNWGPDAAEQVVLTDTLCCNLPHQAVYGEGWVCENSTQAVTCERVGLSSGQVSTLTAVVEAPEEPMTIWTTAEVSSDTPDPDPTNNYKRLILRFAEPGADLWLRKRDSADPVLPGAVFSYVVTVRNSGPDDAEGTVVTDTLPAELELLSVEVSQGTCSDTICSLGPFPAFGRAAITLTVTAPAIEGVYTNTVHVGSNTLDQYLGNNEAYEAVRVRLPRVYLPTIRRSFPSVTE